MTSARTCGGCTLCCKVLPVRELAKATARDIGWTKAQINHPSNYVIMPTAEHLHETRTKDVPPDREEQAHRDGSREVPGAAPGQSRPSR